VTVPGLLAVTGGAHGIGRAAVLAAAERGHAVAVLDRDGAAAREVAGAANAAGASIARFEALDVTEAGAVDACFEALDADAGLGALLCCAGIDAGGPSETVGDDVWDAVVGVDLRGTWLCCRAAIRCFARAGRAGAIVCTSSPAAEVGLPGGTAAYSAAKGGVSALVRSLAVEYAERGIRVNAIAPGPTETELMWANVESAHVAEMRRVVAREVPIGRLADPREPALAALWLLSDEASYVTGAQLAVDGGVLARASVSV
jgi:NAD(P)-dependent dehydrogenase (short-subunit alcohol dehydrogenase family)